MSTITDGKYFHVIYPFAGAMFSVRLRAGVYIYLENKNKTNTVTRVVGWLTEPIVRCYQICAKQNKSGEHGNQGSC